MTRETLKAMTKAEVEKLYRKNGGLLKRTKKAMIDFIVWRKEGIELAQMRAQIIRSM